MKGKTLLVILAVLILLPTMALAQAGASDPKAPYVGWRAEAQTRNVPAGTVQDPASQLTYIVDTGVNLRAQYGADLSAVTGAQLSALQAGSLLQPHLDPDGDGVFNEGTIWQNFLAISNVHPTQAVTVHFRYYNDNCEDILDFLVVLTCNDTLIFDPFNFVIPFTDGENSRFRLIGYPDTESHILTPIPSALWGSGRFVITAAASVTTIDANDYPEILFPYEWRGFDEKCNIEAAGDTLGLTPQTIIGLDNRIAGFDADVNGQRNVGLVGGFDDENLHVFNAFQASFNFLIGNITTAIQGTFATGPGADAYLSFGVPAWGRPVVDRTQDFNDNSEGTANIFTMSNPTSLHSRSNPFGVAGGPNPDGDGPHVLNYVIAWGGEEGRLSTGLAAQTPFTNFVYLRNEVHGGDIAANDYPNATMPAYTQDGVSQAFPVDVNQGSDSWYGALGTGAFLQTQPEDQLIHFLSVADDYNGSNNTPITATSLRDASANISPAVTTYVLQIYDNDENILTFDVPPSVPVSPPQIQATSILKITCICLRVFRNFRNQQTNHDDFNGSGTGNLDELSLDELNLFGTNLNVFGQINKFRGLLRTLDPWADSVSEDISGGWIRFVRDNTVRAYVPKDTGTSVETYFSSGYGTSTFNATGYADHNIQYGASFMTIGLYVVKFEGFGASWYLWTVASDPRVSETGDETP